MLRPDIRAEAVRGLLAERGRVGAALYANPHEHRGKLQRQLERYLLGQAKPLSHQTPEELEATLQVAVWLAGVLDDVPEVAEVQTRLDYFRLLAPFEALAGDGVFQGRRRELDRLRRYIGVVAPSQPDAPARTRFPVAHAGATAAISISGIGGAGSRRWWRGSCWSTPGCPTRSGYPSGYLDFARTTLDVGEPIGQCRELLRQLNLQFPAHALAHLFFGYRNDLEPPRQRRRASEGG